MTWDGFFYVRHDVNTSFGPYAKNLTFDRCIRICASERKCTGIQWTPDERCWLQTSVLKSTTSAISCNQPGRFFYSKNPRAAGTTGQLGSLIEEVSDPHQDVPDSTDRTCPCPEDQCTEIHQCFERIVPDTNPTSVERQHCNDAWDYQASDLSALYNSSEQCKTTLRPCEDQLPACFQNITLKWEEDLEQASSTQFLLQRSGQGLATQARGTNMQKSGLGDDLDDVYGRKSCR
jgi:hypothetical protein